MKGVRSSMTSTWIGSLTQPFFQGRESVYYVHHLNSGLPPVPGKVTLVEVVAQADSLLVTWNRPSNVSCSPRSYVVTHQLVRQLQCAGPAPGVTRSATLGNSSLEYQITGLLPDSLYTVTVRANNAQGSGEPVAQTVATLSSGTWKLVICTGI